ncbi:hypothetical protein ACFQ4C_11460 [Larkinella insperata]|uniref:Lipocalin-like domain-containing protein n=1 Tax=Larkinella insperata TaxID=332158 RepID=A0ABW3Q8M0_9BACT|nr:hypothetical protein [Larkinella insperata]
MKTRILSGLLAIALVQFSCKEKNDDPQPNQDPIIGSWYLKTLQANGQTADVANLACYKDTRFVADEKTLTLTVSAPKQQGSTDCQTQSQSAQWEKDGGKYYMVANGQRSDAGIQLNEAGQTLQMMVTADGEPVTLTFQK